MLNKRLGSLLLSGLLTLGTAPLVFSQSGQSDIQRDKPGVASPGKDLDHTPIQDEQQDHPERRPDLSSPAMDQPTGKVEHEYQSRAVKAAEVLQNLTQASDNRIPDTLLGRAEAIAVIPGMVKGAFGIGGTYGKGLVSERTADGRWGAPVFISIGGGSFGFQLGANATDLVLVFTDRAALNSLEKGMSIKLGVDAGVTAGPIGREGQAAVSQNVRGGIFAYSRSKGLFAGIALNGDVLDLDKTANRKVYGDNMDADSIMRSTEMASNVNVRPFVEALERTMPLRRSTR
jgi:lipid-binding SYLF domain-containing protein